MTSMMLIPRRFVNIRRGQIICAILGFAICPWLLQAKATRFFAFLNGYTVFLGPLVGLLVSDYWLVRQAKGFNVPSLYRPGNRLYWYTGGVNPRAIVALLTGIVPLLPGLAHNINPSLSVARGAIEYYSLSWLVGLVLSMAMYYILYRIFPFATDPEYEIEGEIDAEVAGSEGTASEVEAKGKE